MQLPLSKMMRWKYFSGGRRGVNARMQVFMEPELSPPTVTRLGSPPNELEKEKKKKEERGGGEREERERNCDRQFWTGHKTLNKKKKGNAALLCYLTGCDCGQT